MSFVFTRRNFLNDAVLFGGASALKLVPSPTQSETVAVERRTSFDGQWKFILGDPDGASQPAFADQAWRKLDVPHDWSIEGAFAEDAPAKGNGGYLPTGIG
jgi:beta-galactosidase